VISRLGCHLDSSLGNLQNLAEVHSECALPGETYGTVRHLQPPPTCSREFVSWLLQFCVGQAEMTLAVNTVGFVMVMCVRVCPLSPVVTRELGVLEPCWGLST